MVYLPEAKAIEGINEPIGSISIDVTINDNVTIVRTALLKRISRYFEISII